MRRALIAAAGTAVGLATLLSYKSAGSTESQKVALPSTSGGAVTATTVPATTVPATTVPATTVPASGSKVKTTSGGRATATEDYTGQLVTYRYGDIQVTVAIKGSHIVDVSVPQNDSTDPHSQMINSEAVPILEGEALTAQGVNIDAVTGATYTSDAFAQALQTALQRAGR
jgi:uncharacterized protein with FMN-binding domain